MMMNSLEKHHGHRATKRWARALWFVLALTGCGGGVDSGGTGSAGSFASGPITGFGSVIVNGVRFDDSAATVTDDAGEFRSRGDLRLGMTTEIRGSAIATDDTAGVRISTASSIAFGSEILGPINSIAAAVNQIVVLGQTVDINPATVFDDISVSGGLPALRLGDVVEVYALFDARTSHFTATRIERKGTAALYTGQYKLRGIVSNLDAVNKEFNIGSARISYQGLIPAPATPVEGSFVRVRLLTAPVAGVWQLAGVRDGVQQPRDQDEVEVEGRISKFDLPTRFSVNGIAVDASGITAPAGLALGVRVEVEGTASGAVLVAREVKIKTENDVAGQEFELRGPIASVDPTNQSFVLRGVAVTYSLTPSETEFRNGLPGQLATGVEVEVRGTLSTNGTRLQANRITFK